MKVKVIWFVTGDWKPCAVSAMTVQKVGNLPPDTEYILYTIDENILQNRDLDAFFTKVSLPTFDYKRLLAETEWTKYRRALNVLPGGDKSYLSQEHLDAVRFGSYIKFFQWLEEPLENEEDVCIYLDWDCFAFGDMMVMLPPEGKIWGGVCHPILDKQGNHLPIKHPNNGILVKNGRFDQAEKKKMLAPFYDLELFNDDTYEGGGDDERLTTLYCLNYGTETLYEFDWRWSAGGWDIEDCRLDKLTQDLRVLHWTGPNKPFVDRSPAFSRMNAWYDSQIRELENRLKPQDEKKRVAFAFMSDANMLPGARTAVFSCHETHPEMDILFFAADDVTAGDPVLNRYCRVIRFEPNQDFQPYAVNGKAFSSRVADKFEVFRNAYGYDFIFYNDVDVLFLRRADELWNDAPEDKILSFHSRWRDVDLIAGGHLLIPQKLTGENIYEGLSRQIAMNDTSWEELAMTRYFGKQHEYWDSCYMKIPQSKTRRGRNPVFIHFEGVKPWQSDTLADIQLWQDANQRMLAENVQAIERYESTATSQNRFAVAFFCDKDYLEGLKVAAYSVMKNSPGLDILVFTNDEEVRRDPVLQQLVQQFIPIRSDEVLQPFRAWRRDFPAIVAEKLTVFRDSHGYEQICLMDADCIVVQDLKPFFELHPEKIRGLKTQNIAEKPVLHGGVIWIPRKFLNEESFYHLLEQCVINETAWEERAIPAAFAEDIFYLPSRVVYSPRSKIRGSRLEPYVIHYILEKPWHVVRQDCDDWYQLQQELSLIPVEKLKESFPKGTIAPENRLQSNLLETTAFGFSSQMMTTYNKIPFEFDRIFCINLDHRLERWEMFMEGVPHEAFHRPVDRFAGLDGKKFDPPPWWGEHHGSWGCYLSHRHLLEQCINDDTINRVLIFQDDARFIPDFAQRVREFHAMLPPDTEWIYYGGQHLKLDLQRPRIINPCVCKPFNVNRLHAFALIGKPMMRVIHRHLCHATPWPRRHNTDHHLGILHETGEHNIYAPTRWLVHQHPGKSDLTGRYMDHPEWRDACEVGVLEFKQ